MPRVKVSDAELEKLPNEAAQRAVLADELRINELYAFAEQADVVCAAWAKKPPAEKKRFLAERARVLKEGDALAASSADRLTASLRPSFADAQAAWKTARARLLTLEA